MRTFERSVTSVTQWRGEAVYLHIFVLIHFIIVPCSCRGAFFSIISTYVVCFSLTLGTKMQILFGDNIGTPNFICRLHHDSTRTKQILLLRLSNQTLTRFKLAMNRKSNSTEATLKGASSWKDCTQSTTSNTFRLLVRNDHC
jgi:hypothetical protein